MIRLDKRKLAGLVLAGVLIFAGASTAFAADVNTDAKLPAQKQFIKVDKEQMTTKIKTALDSLVKAGTITQSQADASLKCFTPGEGRMAPKGAIPKEAIKNNPLKETLEELVKAGTITQAQADAILKALQEKLVNTVQDRLEAGKQRGRGFKEDSGEQRVLIRPGVRLGQHPLKGLVSDGTLTQEQADAILKEIQAALKPESNQ